MPGDQPVFLHRHSARGYTTDPGQAMRREPEPVPADTLSALTERSHREHDAQLVSKWIETRRRLLTTVDHFIEQSSPTAGLRRDLHSDMRVITRVVARVDRRLGVGS